MRIFKPLIIATTKPIFLVLFCALLLAHCGKKNDCEKVTEAPAEFLAPFWFAEGSYWVYERTDTNALVIDTMTIGSRKMSYETFADHEAFNPCYMDYLISYVHSNDLFNLPGTDRGFEVFTSIHLAGQWTWQHDAESSRGYIGFLYKWPYSSGDTIMLSKAGNSSWWVDITDTNNVSLKAGDFNHADVISVHLNNYSRADSINIGGGYRQLIIKKNVGILTIEYVDGMRWELAEYSLK
ncbi:MAG: hypothetical protein WD077_05090 [Bacteroidia bacterium]